MAKQTTPAAGLIGQRGVRCLLAAMATAALTVPVAHLLQLVALNKQPYLFILVLAAAFIGAQIHERLHRQAQN